jgi:hypothetical protein
MSVIRVLSPKLADLEPFERFLTRILRKPLPKPCRCLKNSHAIWQRSPTMPMRKSQSASNDAAPIKVTGSGGANQIKTIGTNAKPFNLSALFFKYADRE